MGRRGRRERREEGEQWSMCMFSREVESFGGGLRCLLSSACDLCGELENEMLQPLKMECAPHSTAESPLTSRYIIVIPLLAEGQTCWERTLTPDTDSEDISHDD